MHAETVLRTNLVSWLKDQAGLSFTFDRASQQHRVKDTLVPSRYPVFSSLSQSIHHLVQNLNGRAINCLMFDKWQSLSKQGRYDVIDKLDDTLRAWGYHDFQFLDCGGRAFAFRTIHAPSGQMRVLRVEAPHADRQDRPKHSTVAQTYHSVEGPEISDIKIEVCDEFLPLNKIPDAKKFHSPLSPFYKYYGDLVHLAAGTNMTYAATYFDLDAEPQNVGLTPCGHVVSFDPQIIQGPEALNFYRHFKDPSFLRDASTEQLRLVYGLPPAPCLQRR